MDHQPRKAADHGAVDADELQIPPDLKFDAARRVGRVPPLDGGGDDVGHLAAIVLHDVGGGALDPVVDLGLQLRVGLQLPADARQRDRQPLAQLARRVGGGVQDRPLELQPE